VGYVYKAISSMLEAQGRSAKFVSKGWSNPHWNITCLDRIYGTCKWQTRAGKKHGTIIHETVELAIVKHNHGYPEFFHSGKQLPG
jgi:hypothetical protein